MFKGQFSQRINLAGAFAKNAHMGQTRKYTGEPYIVHPSAVAELLRLNYKGCTEETVSYTHLTLPTKRIV